MIDDGELPALGEPAQRRLAGNGHDHEAGARLVLADGGRHRVVGDEKLGQGLRRAAGLRNHQKQRVLIVDTVDQHAEVVGVDIVDKMQPGPAGRRDRM